MLKRNVGARAQVLFMALAACVEPVAHAQGAAAEKPRVAVFSGPTATIQNNTPLITSNKARGQYGLPLQKDPWGQVTVDQLRYQRLAAPVTVYIEMFTAHPLESDVKELYAAPDGYVNARGEFSKQRRGETDKPVFAVTLAPGDGLYPLPYMARQANGQPWEGVATRPDAPFSQSRQTFVPDASRIFEEIERNGGQVAAKANYDFYRAVPAGGYTKGLPANRRTDVGQGDIPPEKLGRDFFSYGAYNASQTRPNLARAVNVVQKALASGKYAGALWLEGSPSVEDTSYWLSLLVDTTLPIAANSAHRNRGVISPDGDGNILQSIDYILSHAWAGIDMLLEKYPLAGIVGEGLAPYSSMSASQDQALQKAVLSGLPVVKTARGDARGLVRVNPDNLFIEGNNLTSTKARLLLTAAIMKYGPLPHAADPQHPTPNELAAIKTRIGLYQQVFETH
ncbi:MAG: hypothetical protein WDO68_07850 [Gammaproteobacteria bacterium]